MLKEQVVIVIIKLITLVKVEILVTYLKPRVLNIIYLILNQLAI